MALTQHESQEMLFEALDGLVASLEKNPPRYPADSATTIVWSGKVIDPDSGKSGYVIIHLLLTEDEQKVVTLIEAPH